MTNRGFKQPEIFSLFQVVLLINKMDNLDMHGASCSQDSSGSDMKDNDFRDLADQLADWEPLATRLNFTSTEIQRMRIDGKERGICNVIFDMLTTWKNKQLPNTNYRLVLRRALERIERQDLAHNIYPTGAGESMLVNRNPHKRKHSDDDEPDGQPPQKYQRNGDDDDIDNGNVHHNCHLIKQLKTESTRTQKGKRKKRSSTLKLKHVPNMPYNAIKMKLQRMSPDVLKDCKTLLKQDNQGSGINEDEINGVQSGEGFVQLMENKNLLHADNLFLLQMVLHYVEKGSVSEEMKAYTKDVLVDLVEYAENRDTQPITLFITKNEQPNGTKRVEFRIKGAAKYTKNKRVKAFILRVAKNLGMKPHQINLIGQGRGSVVVILQIPEGGLSRLRDAVLQKAAWLVDEQVLGVHIDGEPYREVTRPMKREGILELLGDSSLSYNPTLNLEEFFSSLMCVGNQDIEMDIESTASSSCAGCSLPIERNHPTSRAKDNVYHKECFTCATCCQPIERGCTFYVRRDGKLLCLQHLIAATTNDIQQLKIFPRTLNSDLETKSSSAKNREQGCQTKLLTRVKNRDKGCQTKLQTVKNREQGRCQTEQLTNVTKMDQTDECVDVQEEGAGKPSAAMETGEQLHVDNKIGFDLQQCQRALRQFYLQSLRIPLKLGDHTTTSVNLDDIYVDLSLSEVVPKQHQVETNALSSYHDMFSKIGPESPNPNRILVKGHAGSGKTSLVSKIAYDWATGTDESPLKEISLLFVLNMALIDRSTNIEEAIIKQLLPGDTSIQAEGLKNFIGRHGNQIMLILDGCDEVPSVRKSCSQGEGSLVKATTNKILRECHILVTTRCFLSEFKQGFRCVEVTGFSMNNVKMYIKKFFTQDEELGERLTSYISSSSLMNSISIVPLMLVELCLQWSDSKGTFGIRTTDLFTAILNRISRHSGKNGDDGKLHIHDLARQLGKIALGGCVQHVTITPAVSKNFSYVLETACQLGIMVCSEPFERNGTPHDMPPVTKAEDTHVGSASNHMPYVNQVSFLHKTFQEYCAAVYLVSLLEEDDKLFLKYLEYHSDVDKALDIKDILLFACGLSPHVARIILRGLVEEIFSSQLAHSVFEFYDDRLPFDASYTMQTFILLCLECNFEAQAADEHIGVLSKLIPVKKLTFVGISDSNAVAIAYFLVHSQPLAIESIVLRTLPHLCDELDDVLWKTVSLTQRNPVSKSTIEKTVKTELDQHECEKPDDYQLAKTPLKLLTRIRLSGFLVSATHFTLDPILLSLQALKLTSIDIKGFNVKREVTQLLKGIKTGHQLHISTLKLAGTGLTGYQTEEVAKLLCLLPNLQVLDLSNNEAGRCLPMLGTSLSKCPFLQALDIKDMQAKADDLVTLLHTFAEFGTNLDKFHMSGNEMNDSVVRAFIANVLKPNSLNDLAVSVGDVSRETHSFLIKAFQGFSSLKKLSVSQSHFPDDLLTCAGDLCSAIRSIATLSLEIDRNVSPQIEHSTWVEFKSKLQHANQLKKLYLYNIALEKRDFEELVEVGCQHKLDRLRYFSGCLPEDLILKPGYDFVELL